MPYTAIVLSYFSVRSRTIVSTIKVHCFLGQFYFEETQAHTLHTCINNGAIGLAVPMPCHLNFQCHQPAPP